MKSKNAILEGNLEYLKLPFIRENYAAAAQKAAAEQSGHLDFLSALVEGETSQRQESAYKARLLRARLPYTKNLGDFQWGHPEKINRQQVENLFRLGFIEGRGNVILLGSCGMGKTHLATALAAAACENGYSTLFTGAAEMVNKLAAAMAVNDIEAAIAKYVKPRLLVIDELGYLPIDKLGADLMFQIISRRYETGSIIVTTNRPFKKWAEVFNNDSVVASVILDRMLHHCETVVIEGKSYRMRDKPGQ